MMRVLVIGGTGTISAHTVADLAAAGHAVTILNRGRRDDAPPPTGVAIITGDRGDRHVLDDAIAATRPDVLIDFVCFEPAQAEALADAAAGHVGHLVFVSTVDVFGFPLKTIPVPESAPLNPPIGAYAEKKVHCETLVRARLAGKVALTIVRPTFSMGRRFVIAFFDGSSATLMNRIRHGLPVVVPGDGNGLIHPSASRDTGAMIAHIAGKREAHGKIYTCGTDGAWRSVDSYIELIASVLGHEPKLVHIPKTLIAEAPLPAVREGIYNNVTRFDLAFGFEEFKADFPDFRWQADLAAPIRACVARLESEGAFSKPPITGIDDVLIAAWEKSRAAFRGLSA